MKKQIVKVRLKQSKYTGIQSFSVYVGLHLM